MEEKPMTPALPPPVASSFDEKFADQKSLKEPGSKPPIGLIIGGVVIVVAIIAAIVLLIGSSNETTGRVRDVFIILMALESIVIGAALVILIVQLATLINLLQNEVKPIIQSTNETVNTLRGTVTFISDNLAEPVIKLNATLAGFKQFFDVVRPPKKRSS